MDLKNKRKAKNKRRRARLSSLSSNKWFGSLRWLIPGIGVKRWFLLILFGTTLIGVGIGVILLDIYRNAPDTWWLPALSALSLRFLPRFVRALIFGGFGLGLIFLGFMEVHRSLIKPFITPGRKVIDRIWEHRRRERGPRIVAIGGGHGLATLLRGLKEYTHNLTAVVTVADDGGSSGRLRREMGIPPPGDIRNCLAALSDDEVLLGQLFQYRFPEADQQPVTGIDSATLASDDQPGISSPGGHSFGNLFISAMVEITGSFEEAVAESGRVLAVHGRVLPSTLIDVKLQADVVLPHSGSEVRIEGESRIPNAPGSIRRVWLEPGNPPAYPEAIQAILAADLIVIGPGSLYTSILPNLLVADLVEAIRASRALKIYVCNVATQPGETDGYSVGDHLRALEEHLGQRVFDIAIVNDNTSVALPSSVAWVSIEEGLSEDYALYVADVVDSMRPWRHDAQKLAQTIIDLFEERTGPLVQ